MATSVWLDDRFLIFVGLSYQHTKYHNMLNKLPSSAYLTPLKYHFPKSSLIGGQQLSDTEVRRAPCRSTDYGNVVVHVHIE